MAWRIQVIINLQNTSNLLINIFQEDHYIFIDFQEANKIGTPPPGPNVQVEFFLNRRGKTMTLK